MSRKPVIQAGRSRQSGGFSLLEILVAFAIMAMSLGVLYRILGNNARQAGQLSGQEQAVLLADSLLAAYDTIPAEGVQNRGQSAGYAWRVETAPYPGVANGDTRATPLYEVRVSVQWDEGSRSRNFQLLSLKPERRQPDRVSR